jgi:hypothetical protein
LYGKAPGNTLYRAAVLVAGMALGAFLAVDASALALYLASGSDSDEIFGGVLILLVIGAGIMFAAYRAFRHGEQVEHRSGGKSLVKELANPEVLMSQVKDVEKWLDRLN